MKIVDELDQKLSTPSDRLINDLKKLSGDILILGAGGKMGPSLCMLAKRALSEAGSGNSVIGVSRFSDSESQEKLNSFGIETIEADLMNEEDLQALPDIKNVIYLVGNKFGTTGNEHITWALNSYLPGRVATKFKKSSIVAFSTGNVYPFVEIDSGGATEKDATGPVGEYAQSCLGRERVFEHFARINETPMLFFRLNYAIDMRYGVLLEVAKSVQNERPIDLSTGHVNVIWQGDANEIALRCLHHCSNPPEVLNVTGPETLSIRWLAEEFGKILDKTPQFTNSEKSTALLSNASKAHRLFGYPKVTLKEMIEWTAEWVQHDGATLDKPTHFQERKGAF